MPYYQNEGEKWGKIMNSLIETYLKIVSIALLATVPCLGIANEGSQNENLLNSKSDTAKILKSQKNQAELSIEENNELTEILGTWYLTYKIKGNTFTDRMEINKISESKKKGVQAWGKLFLDNKGDGTTLLCSKFKKPQQVAYYEAEYSCVGHQTILTNRKYLDYALQLSGDKMTHGYFGIGNTTQESAFKLHSKTVTVTGYRDEVENEETGAKYNKANKTLNIPVITYQGSNFQLVLEDKGDFVFFIKDIQPVVQKENGIKAVYDEEKRVLTIPQVTYQESIYRVMLQNKGNFIFTIKEAQAEK